MPVPAILIQFCLISAVITYGLGIFVYAKSSSSASNRLFLVTMLAASYWAFGEFMIWHAASLDGVRFWLKLSTFWPFVVAFAAHFILVFTENPAVQRKPYWAVLAALYIPALVFALIGLLTDLVYTAVYQPGSGLFYMPVQDSPAYIAETIYILVVILWAAFTSYRSWQQAAPGRKRHQNALVCLGVATVIIFGFLSGVLLPSFGVHLPNLVFIGIVLFSLIITYTIQKYGLFELSPQTAVPDILRMMPDGLVLSDIDGRILSANASAAAIFSVEERNLPGHAVGEFLPEPAGALLWSDIREHGGVSDHEVILDNDSNKVVSIAGSVVKDPEGEPAGFVLILRDITHRKESERSLRLANEKISLLTRLTRHDINNLLTGLWGYLELLKENRTGPASDQYISSSIDVVRKIDRYLQFSREYQEIGAFQPVWQSLESVVGQAIDDLPHDKIEIIPDFSPVEIYADPLVVKVMYNLFENAVRHGGHLTRIKISARITATGEMIIGVEDDGVGIPDEDKERVFTYGFGKHTGFGLAFTRGILALTGITIHETGKAGEGARFEIIVPKEAYRLLPADNAPDTH
ncbi:MAG: histidine kinase N-terminal 7TM domain-containing protein [Methanoregula sp.]|jgi:PAS domain S-box-containing protein